MKNYCGSFKHMRAVDGKQNLQFHWPKGDEYNNVPPSSPRV
jgi:hypothetical protein